MQSACHRQVQAPDSNKRCNRGEHQAPYMMGRWPDRDAAVDSRYRIWNLDAVEVDGEDRGLVPVPAAAGLYRRGC